MANLPKIRCAVYTRKSTEDGLEQEFNSLDAQRDACSAYVMSQLHEGWILVPEHYDDGGFSGGTMERPALKRLLADVAARKVDVIVIYKIDRLTRSLMDFSRIVEVLDAAGASFVSITQSFNTTTSMGRLTLNMLLSFAQFEREVTGERIRDKIAASKRKGLWMGGPVPLGYDVQDRKLVVNEAEAERVRYIMRRYVALGSVKALVEELARDGYRTKIQQRSSGPHKGGCAFQRGTLFHLLKNPIYRGKIVHRDAVYEGEHPAIVDDVLWDAVQAALADRASGPAKRTGTHISLLVGFLSDGHGRPMTPSHASKAGRRFRYYCTRPEQVSTEVAWRVSAFDLEKLVINELVALLLDRSRIGTALKGHVEQARELSSAFAKAEEMAGHLRTGSASERLALLTRLKPEVQLLEDGVTIRTSAASFIGAMEIDADADGHIEMICHAVRVRRGHEIKLVIPDCSKAQTVSAQRDEKLIALLTEAFAARDIILQRPDQSINHIAKEARRCRTRLSKLFALAHLAPSIVTEILGGKQPNGLTRKHLLEIDLPIAWDDQRRLLGFA